MGSAKERAEAAIARAGSLTSALGVYERTPKIKRPPAHPPRVIRHKGTIEGDILFLEKGAWVRSLSSDGDQLSDLYDGRWLCRLEIGDGAILSEANGVGLCSVIVTAILADWGRKFRVANALFRGPCFVLPCTGLRK